MICINSSPWSGYVGRVKGSTDRVVSLPKDKMSGVIGASTSPVDKPASTRNTQKLRYMQKIETISQPDYQLASGTQEN
jgi:hypothetical protein